MIKAAKTFCFLSFFLFTINTYAQKFEWAKNISGESANGKTNVYAITTDEKENIYVTGTFEGTVDFDPSEKSYTVSSVKQSPDIYILKLNSAGEFLWCKQITGLFYENCLGVKIDKSGSIILAGYFTKKVDFDPGERIFELEGDDYDIFVCKLNSDGNFDWAKKMGGSATDICNSLALDTKGNIYISGSFTGMAHFGINEKLISLNSKGADDVFVCKLNSTGEILWAKNFGGTSVDQSYSLALDKNANIYITGYFYEQTNFESIDEKYEVVSYGGSDVFIAKLNTDGKFIWTKRLGSASDDFGRSITVDSKDNILITGSFRNKMRIVQGKEVFNLYATTGIDAAYICKMNIDGKFIWTKNIGYVYRVDAFGIASDIRGGVYSVGTFSASTDFDPGEKSDTLTSSGNGDVYICKLNSKGDFEWSKNFGGIDNETVSVMTISSKGNIFVSGTFNNKVDFDPGKGEYFLNTQSLSSVYLVKLKTKN